jgi:hypothetical protein
LKKYPISVFDDSLGEKANFEKAQALDTYLEQKFGEAWQGVKSNVKYLPNNAIFSKQLCHFFLVATSAIKRAESPLKSDNEMLNDLAKPFKNLGPFSSPQGSISLSLLCGHPSVEIDISAAWHPSWQNGILTAFESVDNKITDQLSSALQIIEETSPVSSQMVSEVCSEICILHAVGTTNEGTSISMTSKIVPGLIYFTPAPVLMTAESIIHEVAHLWLSRHEAGGDLYLDSNRMVTSPLRPDPRPLSGLTHQVWVLSNLVPFYSSLLNLKIPVVLLNKPKIEKRLAQHETDLNSGLQTLNDNASGLTMKGQEFLSRINVASN